MNTRVIGNIHLSVEFATDFRLKGWAYDIHTSGFPAALAIQTADSAYPISGKMIAPRADVSSELGLDAATATGFDINLLDLMNARAGDYRVTFGDTAIWSRKEYTRPLSLQEYCDARKLTQQFGTRQVVVVYDKGKSLHNALLTISNWNPSYFEKGYQSGTSFLFCDLNEFGSFKDRLIGQRHNLVCFIEQSIYKQAFSVSPTLVSSAKVLLVDEYVHLDTDFNGLMASILALSGIAAGARHTARSICDMLTAVAAYGNLLFDNDTAIYSFQSGTPAPWMKKCMREIVQQKCSDDVVVLSANQIRRLSEIDSDNCCVFARTSSLRHLLTVLNNEPRSFVEKALRLGCRVRVLHESDNS